MQLELIDWAIIVGYFVVTLGIGAWFTRRAGSNIAEFFVSGRSLPWWIAGTSMVATTFAADTPLAVTALIVKNGLAGNWFWWAFAIGGMFTVFVYARMWRRAEVMTDVELIKLRYQGRAANCLRYLRSFYVALIVNPIIIGWVIGAMLLILEQTVFFDLPEAKTTDLFWNREAYAWLTVGLMMVIVGVYCTLSGMWGVAIADVLQFCLAMGGCIWLAIVAVNHVGGIENLQAKIEANYGDQQAFEFLPSVTTGVLASEQADTLGVADWDVVSAWPPEIAAAESVLGAAQDLLDEPKLGVVAQQAIRERMELVNQQVEALPPDALQAGYWIEEDNDPDDSPYKKLNEEVKTLRSSIGKATPGPWILLHVFLIMLTMQWWATWYPGAEPGGGGYVVQRMAACKDEKNAVLATLWYQIAHYCIRPWPWIMISFVALAIYPELRANYIADSEYDPGIGFPIIMRELCTPGLAGLMLVAFFAAFMSTMSTQMNWGASYLVRDFAQPLFMKNANDKQLTQASRIISVLILLIGFLFGIFMKYPSLLTGEVADENEAVSVDDAWKFLAALGAGTGLVFMLRWFWWRINAWSEIVAMVASLGYFLALNHPWIQEIAFGGHSFRPEEQMAIIAGLTIATWLLATFITRPEPDETLCNFFSKIRPGGPGWKPIAAKLPAVEQDKNLTISIVGAIFASGIVYLVLPAIGYFIFGKTTLALACLAGAAVCAVVVGIITGKLFK